MIAEIAFALVLPFFLAALLFWYFYGPHQDYWQELTRHRLFIIRDRLFDAALQHEIEFDDKAYQVIRMTINGMIQFIHEASPMSLLLVYVFHRKRIEEYGQKYEDRMNAALKGASKDAKKLVLRARGEMHLVILIHIYHTSLPLWLIFVPLVNALKLADKVSRVRRWVLRGPGRKRQWVVLDETAFTIGARSGDPMPDCR